MKPRIVLTRRMLPDVTARARSEFEALIPEDDAMNADGVIEALTRHKADGLFFTTGTRMDAAMISRLPESVRVLSTCSVGTDHIDITAAKARGLIVTNTPDVLTDATADLAFMLILCASRRANEYQAVMREGWQRFFGMIEMLGSEVSGKTLGIVGMGRIGAAVARRARGFDMKVIYHNRTRRTDENGAEFKSSLNDLLAASDIVSLHCPASPGAPPLMDRAAFEAIKPGAIFVNTARGSLVDEDALLSALSSGRVRAAGLDVFAREPAFDKRFADLPNVFLTPHMGSATVETRTAMGMRALDNLAAVLAGRPARDPV